MSYSWHPFFGEEEVLPLCRGYNPYILSHSDTIVKWDRGAQTYLMISILNVLFVLSQLPFAILSPYMSGTRPSKTIGDLHVCRRSSIKSKPHEQRESGFWSETSKTVDLLLKSTAATYRQHTVIWRLSDSLLKMLIKLSLHFSLLLKLKLIICKML